jgi:hypothetical protein
MFKGLLVKGTYIGIWKRKTSKKRDIENQSPKLILNWIRNCRNGKLNQLRAEETLTSKRIKIVLFFKEENL